MSTWTDFLSTRGAKVENGVVIDFGDPPGELAACKGETVVADLSHFGLIGFSGQGAQNFLHGQIDNDPRLLRETAAVFAGFTAVIFAFAMPLVLSCALSERSREGLVGQPRRPRK